MLRSLYSAISGMQAFETKLDVIGNNIANVNTTGFKAGRADFSDVLSQTMSGGSAPTAALGGTNPQQIGLGVHVAAIQTLFTQGANQATGVPTDVMMNGAGLFVVSPDGGNHLYLTREGDFTVDSANNLVLPNGAIAQGFAFKNVPAAAPAPAASVVDTSKLVPTSLDSMLTSYVASLPGTTDGTGVTYQTGATPGANQITYKDAAAVITTRSFSLPNAPDVQIGPDGSVSVQAQYTDTQAGPPVTTVGSGTERVTIGKLGVATVNNPGGLEKMGDSMYVTSANSGSATYQVAGTNNTGTINSGYIEMSNVDLTKEFTEMIVAQRGFDANSKMIGTDNSILQDIVNLKNA